MLNGCIATGELVNSFQIAGSRNMLLTLYRRLICCGRNLPPDDQRLLHHFTATKGKCSTIELFGFRNQSSDTGTIDVAEWPHLRQRSQRLYHFSVAGRLVTVRILSPHFGHGSPDFI
jgi:hypothetical protein